MAFKRILFALITLLTFVSASAQQTPAPTDTLTLPTSVEAGLKDSVFADNVVVRYRVKSDTIWAVSDTLHKDSVSSFLHSLPSDQDYEFTTEYFGKAHQFSMLSEEQVYEQGKITDKKEGDSFLFTFLMIVGSLGFFIYGMKVMSEGIQKLAGSRMRRILSSITSNKFAGVGIGFLTTAIIQSSSATTVMVVSFVNAGLLSLKQAVGVIMGANIGTTVTAILLTFLGFGKLSLSTYALPIIAIAFPLMFMKNDRIKSLSEFLIGFALLFMGLGLLKNAIPDLDKEALAFLQDLNGYGVGSTLIFILIGTLLTVIVQSSSAAMAMTLVFCNEGYIQFDMAAAIVLGENIGTTITANLAALIGNTNAKRAARAHFLFNVFGVLWMVFIFQWFIEGVAVFVESTFGKSPMEDTDSVKLGLTFFHIFFNILNTGIMIWFIPQIVKLSTKMVKSKGDIDDEFTLKYIGGGIMPTPELSILQAKKEVYAMGDIVSRMNGFTQKLLIETERKKRTKLHKRVKKYEEITDRLEIEIANYIAKVSEQPLAESSSIRARGMLSSANDLERVGDIYFQISKTLERKYENNIYFTPKQRENLTEYMKLTDRAFKVLLENLDAHGGDFNLDKARAIEKEMNAFRNKLRKEHLANMEKGNYNINSGMIYADIFSSIERIGDHLINVSEAATGLI